MTSSRIVRLLALFLVLLATGGCDQATKHLARTRLSEIDSAGYSHQILRLTLAENPGAFLSFGAGLPDSVRSTIFTVGVAVGLLGLLAYLIRASKMGSLTFLGLALIWAGGASNLVDRIWRHGMVTDFMVIQIGPVHTGVFNVADFAVVTGLLLVAVSTNERFSKRPAVAGANSAVERRTPGDDKS